MKVSVPIYERVVKKLTEENCNFVKLQMYDENYPQFNCVSETEVKWTESGPCVNFNYNGYNVFGPLDQFDGRIVEYGFKISVPQLT